MQMQRRHSVRAAVRLCLSGQTYAGQDSVANPLYVDRGESAHLVLALTIATLGHEQHPRTKDESGNRGIQKWEQPATGQAMNFFK